MEDAWVAPSAAAGDQENADGSFFLLISHLFLVPSRMSLSLSAHFHLTALPSPFIWTFPDRLLAAAAAAVASCLASSGIRDLRLAWSLVSPLIHSQIAPCTVSDGPPHTHDPKPVLMGSPGDGGLWSSLESCLCQRPNLKDLFSYRVLQVWCF